MFPTLCWIHYCIKITHNMLIQTLKLWFNSWHQTKIDVKKSKRYYGRFLTLLTCDALFILVNSLPCSNVCFTSTIWAHFAVFHVTTHCSLLLCFIIWGPNHILLQQRRPVWVLPTNLSYLYPFHYIIVYCLYPNALLFFCWSFVFSIMLSMHNYGAPYARDKFTVCIFKVIVHTEAP